MVEEGTIDKEAKTLLVHGLLSEDAAVQDAMAAYESTGDPVKITGALVEFVAVKFAQNVHAKRRLPPLTHSLSASALPAGPPPLAQSSSQAGIWTRGELILMV